MQSLSGSGAVPAVADLARPGNRRVLGTAATRPPAVRELISASTIGELACRLAQAEGQHGR
jgi:hypothetical protein